MVLPAAQQPSSLLPVKLRIDNTDDVPAHLRCKKYPHPRPTIVGFCVVYLANNVFYAHACGVFPHAPVLMLIRTASSRAAHTNKNNIENHSHCCSTNNINEIGIAIMANNQKITKYFIQIKQYLFILSIPFEQTRAISKKQIC